MRLGFQLKLLTFIRMQFIVFLERPDWLSGDSEASFKRLEKNTFGNPVHCKTFMVLNWVSLKEFPSSNKPRAPTSFEGSAQKASLTLVQMNRYSTSFLKKS